MSQTLTLGIKLAPGANKRQTRCPKIAFRRCIGLDRGNRGFFGCIVPAFLASLEFQWADVLRYTMILQS